MRYWISIFLKSRKIHITREKVQKFLMKKYEYSDIEYMQYIIGAKSKDEIPDNENVLAY